MADKLLLEDVRFYGQHGLTRAEQVVGAWFSVDVELAVDLSSAMVSDQVAATVDYGLVARRIVEIGTKNRVNLIERLAGLIVEAMLREVPLGRIGQPAVLPQLQPSAANLRWQAALLPVRDRRGGCENAAAERRAGRGDRRSDPRQRARQVDRPRDQ